MYIIVCILGVLDDVQSGDFSHRSAHQPFQEDHALTGMGSQLPNPYERTIRHQSTKWSDGDRIDDLNRRSRASHLISINGTRFIHYPFGRCLNLPGHDREALNVRNSIDCSSRHTFQPCVVPAVSLPSLKALPSGKDEFVYLGYYDLVVFYSLSTMSARVVPIPGTIFSLLHHRRMTTLLLPSHGESRSKMGYDFRRSFRYIDLDKEGQALLCTSRAQYPIARPENTKAGHSLTSPVWRDPLWFSAGVHLFLYEGPPWLNPTGC